MTGFGPRTLEGLRSLLANRSPVEWDPQAGNRRESAVLIPLYLADGEVHVVLAKRSEHLRSHSGEMAFPGGGRDPGDLTLRGTALREAEEEVGIRPHDVEVIGVLDDMPTAGSGYVIRPYVGVIPYPYSFVPDGVETTRVVTAPLAWFADPSRLREQTRHRDGVRYEVHSYDLEGEVVWGATARILLAVVSLAQDRDPDPPAVIPLPRQPR